MSNPAPHRQQRPKAAEYSKSLFGLTQRALVAEQKLARAEKRVAELEAYNANQTDTIQQVVGMWFQAQQQTKMVEQNGLTLIAALVRTAGGTVRVPQRFIADNTGILDNQQDETKDQLVISWRPAEPVEEPTETP